METKNLKTVKNGVIRIALFLAIFFLALAGLNLIRNIDNQIFNFIGVNFIDFPLFFYTYYGAQIVFGVWVNIKYRERYMMWVREEFSIFNLTMILVQVLIIGFSLGIAFSGLHRFLFLAASNLLAFALNSK